MKILASLIAIAFFVAACAGSPEAPGPDPEASSPTLGARGGMCAGVVGIRCAEEGDYCALPAGVCRNTADAAGVCTQKPRLCTADYRPVCGCDGRTYGNACAAAGKGVSVAAEGECPEPLPAPGARP